MTTHHSKKFPPILEELSYMLFDSEEKYVEFNFPSPLVKLALWSYPESGFDMNLPVLESMEMENCCGPVPPSVKTLVVNCRMTCFSRILLFLNECEHLKFHIH